MFSCSDFEIRITTIMMESSDSPKSLAHPHDTSYFNDENIQRLKDKYSQEIREDDQSPIKVCMKLIFRAAIEKDRDRRSNISHELSNFMIKPDGIINLFLTVIDFDTSSQKVTTHNQRFIAIANMIARLPKLCLPYPEYCTCIAKQLKPLILNDNPKYSSLASIIFKSLLESPHARLNEVEDLLIAPMIRAFQSSHCDSSLAPSYRVDEAIVVVHNLVQHMVPSCRFVDIFPHMFYCYAKIFDSPSQLKTILRKSLTTILNDLRQGAAVCLLHQTIFHLHHLRDYFKQTVCDEGVSVEIVIPDTEMKSSKDVPDNEPDESFGQTVKVCLQLLEDSNNQLLILEFYFHFQSELWSSRKDDHRSKCALLIEPLLEITTEEGNSSRLDLFEVIMSHTEKALNLIASTLTNYVECLRESQGPEEDACRKFVEPSLNSCVTILEVLSTMSQSDSALINERILPLLSQIQKSMTLDSQNKTFDALSSLIEKLKASSPGGSGRANLNEFEREFDSLIKDLNDPLVPIRVHSLVRLKQMILANDKRVIEKIPHLYHMVESSLADQESYVFLACINLIAEMSVRRTAEILPKLVALYTCNELGAHQRLNVGEVLVRLTKQLNKTAPHYAGLIFSTLITSINHEQDDLMCISSMTNIGELCRHLGDSLGKYMVEILACVEVVLQSAERSIEVKCAAVELIRTALMGVDRLTIESIQREVKSIYSLLKKLRHITLDDNLCLLVDLALEEVNRIAKEMLGLIDHTTGGSEINLTKNIKCLSLFDKR